MNIVEMNKLYWWFELEIVMCKWMYVSRNYFVCEFKVVKKCYVGRELMLLDKMLLIIVDSIILYDFLMLNML